MLGCRARVPKGQLWDVLVEGAKPDLLWLSITWVLSQLWWVPLVNVEFHNFLIVL